MANKQKQKKSRQSFRYHRDTKNTLRTDKPRPNKMYALTFRAELTKFFQAFRIKDKYEISVVNKLLT